jgi:DNA (cytosine-5)-methyltransferase 1
MRYGSLFSGIGGIDLGFDRAGMECIWQVEIDNYATKVLEKHWPKVQREKDIRECGKHNLEWVDVIAGGFPCQDISYAGRGAGLDGERSGLFYEAIRVVQELRPRIVVLENVAALLTRGMDRVLGTLAEIGYDAEWHCIPATAVGAPHIRDRVFVVAYANMQHGERRGKSRQSEREERKARTEPSRSSSDVPNATSTRLQRRTYIGDNAEEKLKAFERSNRERGGCWFSDSGICRVANGVSFRLDRLRGLGNAVVPQVAEWIERRLMQIESEE